MIRDIAAVYVVDRYDVADRLGEPGRWRRFARTASARAAVRAIRKLRARGYCEVSIYVERLEAAGRR